MKLAEALMLRADARNKIEEIRQRLLRNAKIQEDEKPSENPPDLLHEMDATLVELTSLIKKVNRTNAMVEVAPGQTLADVLAERDAVALKRKVLNSFLEAMVVKVDRYSRSEVKYFSTVDISAIQKQIDSLARRYRELDTKIQQTNWTVDLLAD